MARWTARRQALHAAAAAMIGMARHGVARLFGRCRCWAVRTIPGACLAMMMNARGDVGGHRTDARVCAADRRPGRLENQRAQAQHGNNGDEPPKGCQCDTQGSIPVLSRMFAVPAWRRAANETCIAPEPFARVATHKHVPTDIFNGQGSCLFDPSVFAAGITAMNDDGTADACDTCRSSLRSARRLVSAFDWPTSDALAAAHRGIVSKLMGRSASWP